MARGSLSQHDGRPAKLWGFREYVTHVVNPFQIYLLKDIPISKSTVYLLPIEMFQCGQCSSLLEFLDRPFSLSPTSNIITVCVSPSWRKRTCCRRIRHSSSGGTFTMFAQAQTIGAIRWCSNINIGTWCVRSHVSAKKLSKRMLVCSQEANPLFVLTVE